MVHAVAMRILSNHHDAQDVTQAVFLVLTREAAKLGGKPSVAGWLHTVSRHLSLDARKSRERRQRREQAAMNESSNITPDATASTGFRRELDAALERLPDRYRQPLVLFHLEGASLNEVARRLDLQPSTLRTRLSRAREKLREILGRRGVEIASVGALGVLFEAEAKASPFTPAILSSVLDTAAPGGAGVSPHILQLADKAAFASTTSVSCTITTATILMKTKAILISAIVVTLAAVGTTTYILSQEDDGTGRETLDADRRGTASQGNPANDPTGKVRERESRFQSLEEAEQALLDFDLMPIREGDREESQRCALRYRALVARIPEAYYGELAARLGEGADQDLMRYLRQMALYQEWGRLDLDAALADLSGIDNVRLHSKALHNAFVGAADADPIATMRLAETLEIETPDEFGESERIDLMDTIFDFWIESDPFSAVQWAKQASVPEKRRDQWIADGLRAWREQDPDAAEKWRRSENFEGFVPANYEPSSRVPTR
ncbi:sigma-70 family RNA polymerase sigma factor [Verrucomicrobiaceae bacterium E54]|nr:sigma-70 family RNA polymerase sigma factor [Verrucomicrobiaceae bacterium E54]